MGLGIGSRLLLAQHVVVLQGCVHVTFNTANFDLTTHLSILVWHKRDERRAGVWKKDGIQSFALQYTSILVQRRTTKCKYGR